MKRLRIGIDIDGVVYQWDRTARYMLREVLPNSPYKDALPFTGLYNESQSWDHIKEQVASEHWEWLRTEAVRLGLYRYGHLYSGAIQGIRELAELGDVVAITHRPKEAVEDTLAWLAYNRFPLAGVHILTNEEPKSTVRPRVDYFVDDKVENVRDMMTTDYTAVALMRRPWNVGFNPVAVVNNLHEYAAAIRGLGVVRA